MTLWTCEMMRSTSCELAFTFLLEGMLRMLFNLEISLYMRMLSCRTRWRYMCKFESYIVVSILSPLRTDVLSSHLLTQFVLLVGQHHQLLRQIVLLVLQGAVLLLDRVQVSNFLSGVAESSYWWCILVSHYATDFILKTLHLTDRMLVLLVHAGHLVTQIGVFLLQFLVILTHATTNNIMFYLFISSFSCSLTCYKLFNSCMTCSFSCWSWEFWSCIFIQKITMIVLCSSSSIMYWSLISLISRSCYRQNSFALSCTFWRVCSFSNRSYSRLCIWVCFSSIALWLVRSSVATCYCI